MQIEAHQQNTKYNRKQDSLFITNACRAFGFVSAQRNFGGRAITNQGAGRRKVILTAKQLQNRAEYDM
jgi:hypothetical protein